MCIPALAAVLFSLQPLSTAPQCDVRWSIVLRDVEVSASLPVKVRVPETEDLDNSPAVLPADKMGE